MKKAIIILGCILHFVMTSAEHRLVFNKTDLSAIIDPRFDLNGNECALLRVVCDIPDIEFKGNIVGDVKRDSTNYVIYISNGSKGIGYCNADTICFIDFSKLGIENVKSRHSYTLYIDPTSTTK